MLNGLIPLGVHYQKHVVSLMPKTILGLTLPLFSGRNAHFGLNELRNEKVIKKGVKLGLKWNKIIS